MQARPGLRLAWDNPVLRPAGPRVDPAPAAPPVLTLLPPVPRRTVLLAQAGRRVNLATAIEAHLAGDDGLSEQDFVALFARGERAGA